MQILPPMNCAESYKLGWVNYAKFTGRARRSEFFYFYIINNAIICIFYSIFYINYLNDYDSYYDEYRNFEDYAIYLYISAILVLVTFLPMLGLQIRRLHDTGKSGWFVLLRFIFIFGDFFLLILFCADSEQTQNEYGPSPKYVMPSGNLIPGNNYNPPVVAYPQSNPVVIPVNQSPLPPQAVPYPQPNPIPYQQPPYMQQDPIPPEAMNIPQPNNYPPQNTPYSHANPNQQPPQGALYPSLGDPYSKPNPMQPPSDNYYNSGQ